MKDCFQCLLSIVPEHIDHASYFFLFLRCRFKVEDKTDKYELRSYAPGSWVVVNISDSKYEIAYTKAALKLIRYFKGHNSAEEKFDTTVPMMSLVELSEDGDSLKQDFCFSMWLPQEKIPKPEDEDVQIMHVPKSKGFVRVFGGFATEGSIVKEIKDFEKILEDEGEEFKRNFAFVAVYDPAYKLIHRHNEIHLLKKEKPIDMISPF